MNYKVHEVYNVNQPMYPLACSKKWLCSNNSCPCYM